MRKPHQLDELDCLNKETIPVTSRYSEGSLFRILTLTLNVTLTPNPNPNPNPNLGFRIYEPYALFGISTFGRTNLRKNEMSPQYSYNTNVCVYYMDGHYSGFNYSDSWSFRLKFTLQRNVYH